jgi:hypothetical protein
MPVPSKSDFHRRMADLLHDCPNVGGRAGKEIKQGN